MASEYARIPKNLMTALKEYRDKHSTLGGFLEAVVSNDLQNAIVKADPASLNVIREITLWVHWELPGHAHGSQEKYDAWTGATDQADGAS